MTTLKSLLSESKHELLKTSSSPQLDAEVLICHALGIEKKDLILLADQKLSAKKISQIRGLVNRRKSGEPIAYIIKRKEFYGLDFFVSPAVLIPRPESEWLVEEALKVVNRKSLIGNSTKQLTILDLGTGSGCLIISLLKNLDIRNLDLEIAVYASDISKPALSIARRNARSILSNKQSAISNLRFVHSDLFSNRLLHKKFDLIITNLPYVPRDNKTIKQLGHEPLSAIFADDNGTSIIKRFLDQVPYYLSDNGTILIELDPRNAKDIHEYAKKLFPLKNTNYQAEGSPLGLKTCITKKDLAGLDRYLIIN